MTTAHRKPPRKRTRLIKDGAKGLTPMAIADMEALASRIWSLVADSSSWWPRMAGEVQLPDGRRLEFLNGIECVDDRDLAKALKFSIKGVTRRRTLELLGIHSRDVGDTLDSPLDDLEYYVRCYIAELGMYRTKPRWVDVRKTMRDLGKAIDGVLERLAKLDAVSLVTFWLARPNNVAKAGIAIPTLGYITKSPASDKMMSSLLSEWFPARLAALWAERSCADKESRGRTEQQQLRELVENLCLCFLDLHRSPKDTTPAKLRVKELDFVVDILDMAGIAHPNDERLLRDYFPRKTDNKRTSTN